MANGTRCGEYGVCYVNGVHSRYGVHQGYGVECEFWVYHLNGGSQCSYVELWIKSKMTQEEEEEEEGGGGGKNVRKRRKCRA